jgi:hypothetical protein
MEFLQEIKLANPKTAYDVQELSKKLIEKRTSLDEFNTIKEFAFQRAPVEEDPKMLIWILELLWSTNLHVSCP